MQEHDLQADVLGISPREPLSPESRRSSESKCS
jgi:hypothetical protein